jgi:hypothetical protein
MKIMNGHVLVDLASRICELIETNVLYLYYINSNCFQISGLIIIFMNLVEEFEMEIGYL